MKKDPEMLWEGDFPYDLLQPAGVTPYSSIREVTHAMRYFTQRGSLPPGVHQALRRLEVIKERLFIDFFLYRKEYITNPEEDTDA